MRPHLAAIYAFARAADDFADEPHRDAAERLRLLDEWSEKLHRTIRAEPVPDPVFVALGATIRCCDLPVTLFDDLLSAFRQDVTVHRYRTWSDVLDYSRRSANPVGRLVLRVAGVSDAATEQASDSLCTALQLTNFWQDFGRDWSTGRLYVPREEIEKGGADEGHLRASHLDKAWKGVIRACVVRTRELFERGRPVTDGVRGRLRLELRATWLGGSRILDKIEALDYDVLHARPSLTLVDALDILPRTLLWKNREHVARSP
jgi:phytoene synthase